MDTEQPLTLSADEMRILGYRAVDMLVEHLETLPGKRITRKSDRATMEARLREPPPEKGTDALTVLKQLERDVFSNMMHPDHPRFFAFVPGPGNFVSAMGDALASGFNVFAGTWLEASGAAQIELVAVDWLRQACGLPETAGGLFVSGGSVANMTSLAVARQIKLAGRTPDAVVYTSDQTHSSIERGMRVLGFQPDQVHKLPSDGAFRFDIDALREAIRGDRAAGRVPFCVVATAGTTNTGSVDPLHALADLCQQESLWLHVDGAYGAAAALTERGKALLAGIERADSLVLDPHKWLFQPFDMGCLLVREARWLESTFRMVPEYLEDTEGEADEINFWERGIQLTRSFRALKLWLSVKVFGWSAFRAAVERGFRSAEVAEAAVRQQRDWEVVTGAQLAVVTFRFAPPGWSNQELDRLNRALVEDLIADGCAMLSSTVLRGRTVLRLCTINPRTTDEDIRMTITRLAELAAQRAAGGSRPDSGSREELGP
jgi:aromatic-L-amino-acid decarboxylase